MKAIYHNFGANGDGPPLLVTPAPPKNKHIFSVRRM
jgi:hypothetical protein